MRKKRRPPKLLCPWCGEPADIFVDLGSGSHQSYVEDCAVCCRPCVVTVEVDEEGVEKIAVARE